jgi:hypothetical protein
MVNHLLALLVDSDVPKETRKKLIEYVATDLSGHPTEVAPNDKTLDVKMRGLIHLIMTLPSYQLA